MDARYAAGFFDGEGTVALSHTVRRRRVSDPSVPIMGFKFSIRLSSTDKPILRRLQSTWGGCICQGANVPGHKQVWTWQITSAADSRAFLKAIRPHVILKAPHVEAALEYVATMVRPGCRVPKRDQAKRHRICATLHRLNRRGIG